MCDSWVLSVCCIINHINIETLRSKVLGFFSLKKCSFRGLGRWPGDLNVDSCKERSRAQMARIQGNSGGGEAYLQFQTRRWGQGIPRAGYQDYVWELWVWLRHPAFMNKGEDHSLTSTLDIHMHTCMCIHIQMCTPHMPHTHTDIDGREVEQGKCIIYMKLLLESLWFPAVQWSYPEACSYFWQLILSSNELLLPHSHKFKEWTETVFPFLSTKQKWSICVAGNTLTSIAPRYALKHSGQKLWRRQKEVEG